MSRMNEQTGNKAGKNLKTFKNKLTSAKQRKDLKQESRMKGGNKKKNK